MKSLSRTLTEQSGETLISPWSSVVEMFDVRLGDSVTVLGAPMSNKSNFMLNWAIQANVPTIYGNFDTPQIDMTTRSLAIMSGDTTQEVMAGMSEGTHVKYADNFLGLWFSEEKDCLTVDFDGYTLMDELCIAYEEFWGEGPKMIVLDNLSDTAKEVNHVDLQRSFKAARDLARRTNTAVFALHHVKRDADEKDLSSKPIRLTDGVGAGERDAATVMGLWKPKYGEQKVLRVAHLKNKRRHADPAGSVYLDFELDQSRATVGKCIDSSREDA